MRDDAYSFRVCDDVRVLTVTTHTNEFFRRRHKFGYTLYSVRIASLTENGNRDCELMNIVFGIVCSSTVDVSSGGSGSVTWWLVDISARQPEQAGR